MNKASERNAAHSCQDKQRYLRIIKILARTCARIMLSVNRPAQDFIRAFKESMIDLVNTRNPRLTLAEMTLRTGIDRRQIRAYLNHQPVSAWQKRNLLSLILAEIDRTIRQHCPDNVLPLTGRPHSFESICLQLARGRLHAKAVLRELERLGNIKINDKGVVLLDKYYFPGNDSLDFLITTVWALDQLGRTIEFNRVTALAAEKNFQGSVYSTQIPPWQVEKLHPQLKATLARYYHEVAELLDAAEDKNIPVGFYPPYGASFFELGRTEVFQPTEQQVMQEAAFFHKGRNNSDEID
jgi:hypothetical protein